MDSGFKANFLTRIAGSALAGIAVALSLLPAPVVAQTAEPVTIRIGFLTSISRGFKIGYDAGKFESKLYKLQLTEFSSPNDALSAIASGQQDIVYTEYARGVAAIKNGYKLVYVSSNGLQIPRAYFLTRADKPLSGKELKGKKIGVGTAPFYYVHTAKWLQSLGYTVSTEPDRADVQILKISESALPAALQNGDIDAVHTWDRINAYQWANDYKFKFVQGAEDGVPVSDFQIKVRTFTGGFFANPDFVQKHPDVVRRFDRDNRLASRWYDELKPEEQRQLWEKAGGKSLAPLAKVLDQKTFDSLLTLRSLSATDPDEKFDLVAITEWIDLVADLTGSVPSSKNIDVRSTVAPWLLK